MPPENHLPLTRHLTDEQKSILAKLTPYKSAMKFLSHCQPSEEQLEIARRELADDINRREQLWRRKPKRAGFL
jgi:hypothetical protein